MRAMLVHRTKTKMESPTVLEFRSEGSVAMSAVATNLFRAGK